MVLQILLFANLQLRHQLAQPGARVLRLEVQRLFAELVRLGKIAVLQRHECPPHQRRSAGRRGGHRLLYDGLGFRRFLRRQLLDAANQILHESQLAHILRLQMGELLWQVVGVHVAVGGHQHLVRTVFDQRQVAAPLVLHPHSVEVPRLRAQHHHDLCAVQRREDVGLVGRADLVLQRDAGEKDFETFLRQLVVEVRCQHAVRGPAAIGIGLLVADKHIEGLFLLRDVQYALLDLRDGVRLGLVDTLLQSVSIVQGGLVVLVRQDRGILRPVHRGHALVARRILHILDTVTAQHQRPIGLGVPAVLREDLLVDGHGLVVFVLPAEVVRPVVQVRSPVVVQFRQGLGRAAIRALRHARSLLKPQVAAAHLAFEGDHSISLQI